MRGPILIVIVLALLVVTWGSIYAVNETDQVILTQFGRPVGGVVDTAGLHLKVPFVQDVHRFDKRWLEYDGAATEIPTKDKKYIWVDSYARWRIADPLRFFQAVGNERGAQSRLDDIIDGVTRDAVASFNLIELVRTTNREFRTNEDLVGIGAAEAQAQVTTGREKIQAIVLREAAAITPQFGVEVVDVRFKRINYVESVQRKVFDRMISERHRIAERSRSEGQGRAAEIRGEKERDVLAAKSAGYRDGELLKGKADAKAAAIYAAAYNKDPDFYQFQKSMETIQKGLDDRSWLILSTDSELLKYLKSSGAR
jgi:membrane protease subunit HflC